MIDNVNRASNCDYMLQLATLIKDLLRGVKFSKYLRQDNKTQKKSSINI